VLVSIFVTLPSRIYKGGQGPLSKQRSLGHSTPKAIQTTIQDVGCYASCGPNLSKLCVPCTFEFLISASPHPKLTTLGISLGGKPVKHRQRRRCHATRGQFLFQRRSMRPQEALPPPQRLLAVLSRACHVVPPSPEATTSRRRSSAAAPAHPCLFLVPPHVQKSFSTSFIRSCARILLPRLLLRSAPRQTTAMLSARRCRPSPPPHTHNPVLHRHHYTRLKLHSQFFSIPSCSRH
jgi:hypothetical protein